MKGINDLMSYKMLYEDNEGYIHQCTVVDYIKGSTNAFGYSTSEDLPTCNTNRDSKEIFSKEVSQAEYNFYRRYGLGESRNPRYTYLKEIFIDNKRIKEIISETLNRFITPKK